MTLKVLLIAAAVLLSCPGAAHAIQQHGGQEGYYAHQISHIVFLAAMVFMYHVLKSPSLTGETGWKWVRRSAMIFGLWNVDAFISHIAEEQLEPAAKYIASGQINFIDTTAYIFYFTRLFEYAFLVPAFLLMVVGLLNIRRHLEMEDRK